MVISKIQEIPARCPNCGSTSFRLDPVKEELYCRKCGTIVSEELLDRSFKYSMFESLKYSPSSKKFIIKYRAELETGEEKALKSAYHELMRIEPLLNIPRYARSQILNLYSKLYKKGFTFGRSRTAVLGALLYIVSRNNNLFYYLDYVSEATKTNKKIIRKFVSKICREIGIKLKPISPENYLIKIGYELNLSEKTITIAREILEEIKGIKELRGRSPITLTAVSLYISAGLRKEDCTFDRIRRTIKVYPDTIRKALKKIENKLDINNLKKSTKWI